MALVPLYFAHSSSRSRAGDFEAPLPKRELKNEVSALWWFNPMARSSPRGPASLASESAFEGASATAVAEPSSFAALALIAKVAERTGR